MQMKRPPKTLLLTLFLAFCLGACSQSPGSQQPAMEVNIRDFSGDVAPPEEKSTYVDYDLSILIEKFNVGLPTGFDPTKTYGLLVYISPGEVGSPGPDWQSAMASRDLLYVSPVGAGNNTDNKRRMGLAYAAAKLMQREYKIDPARIYVSGFSGGARTANALCYVHPELFSGAILNCGACFHDPVPRKSETSGNGGQQGDDYTVILDKSFLDIETVREKVRFALVTGPADFRYGNILDIYEGGYKPSGFQARLFDIPGMGHADCTGEVLGQAIDFLDGKS